MNNTIVTVKDAKAANKNDLKNLLQSIQYLLDAWRNFTAVIKTGAHITSKYPDFVAVVERFDRAPIAVRLYLDENNGNIESLERLKEEINLSVALTA